MRNSRNPAALRRFCIAPMRWAEVGIGGFQRLTG